MPLPVAYWTLKVVDGAAQPRLHRRWCGSARASSAAIPRFAVVFVALNPIYLIYAVGGFHNDFFMLVPSMARDLAAARPAATAPPARR